MLHLTQCKSDAISSWIKNICDLETNTILLLVGNQTISEDIIINQVIKQLFNTGIVVTLTDNMLQKESFEKYCERKIDPAY